jgi:hypothetical protein
MTDSLSDAGLARYPAANFARGEDMYKRVVPLCMPRARASGHVARETSALDPSRPLLDPQHPAGHLPRSPASPPNTVTFMIQIWQHFIQMPPLTPTCPVPTTISPILVMILLSDTQCNRRIQQYRQHSGVNCHVVQAVPIHWSFGLGHPTKV